MEKAVTSDGPMSVMGKEIGRKRYWIAVFCFVVYVVAFLDRSNIGVLIADPGFTNALGITNDKATQGSLMSAFLLVYGITCFLAGPAVQRFGPRNSLLFGALSWAVLTGIMGAVSSTFIFLVCRALLGVGESVLGPGVSKLVQTWFPVKERASANGAWYLGTKVAQIIAMPLIAWWIAYVGWRGSFFILALIGLVPVILCVFSVFDHPSKHPTIKKEEVEYIISGSGGGPGGSEKTQKSEFGFLKNWNFWGAVVIYSIMNATMWGFVVWVPSYLKTTLGFSWSAMGSLSALPYICGFVSVGLVSPIMDKLNRRALFTMICAITYSVALSAAMFTESRTVAVIVLSLALAAGAIIPPACWAMVQNVTSRTQVATATGFLNGIAYVFASLIPMGMGSLYNITGTLKTGFYALGGLAVIAFLFSIPLARRRL
jgi:sugar phosphate permease